MCAGARSLRTEHGEVSRLTVLILLIMAVALVALWLGDRARRRSSDARAVADSRATLERLGGIVTSVRRDEPGPPGAP